MHIIIKGGICMITLSENEYKIIAFMWKEGRPVSRSELLKGTEGRNWNPASIHLILNSMISKGAIKITDEEKTYGRTYEPCLSYDEYLIEALKNAVPDKSIEEILSDCKRIKIKNK
jgi:predicted transcriptional regulator